MIIGWIILSVVVGIAGSAREIGGLRSFAVSVLFSPLIGFIVVLFSKRKDLIEFENTTLRKQQEQLDLLKNKSIADELLKLTQLKDNNSISEEEFNSLKTKLISNTSKEEHNII